MLLSYEIPQYNWFFMNKIISLQEVQPDRWVAKYHGNYGVYTIRLSTNERGRARDYSCSCPSDGFPCKHIGFIEDAIAERRANRQGKTSGDTPTPEELLESLSPDELRIFVLKQVQYNDALRNAILLEFATRIKNEYGNPYSAILRDILENTRIDEDDLWQYDDLPISIDAVDDLFDKATSFIREEKYNEAASIAKACIEELSSWCIRQSSSVCESMDLEWPFEILVEIAEKNGCDANALYRYCETERAKDKYAKAGMSGGFDKLLLSLAKKTGNMEFLALQDKLMEEVPDKTSYMAATILERKMDFYRATGHPEKADEILEANIQIDRFRRAVIEKRIAAGNFADARALILQVPSSEHFHQRRSWEELLLTIAQKENNTAEIREIAFRFIEESFNKEYYDIYKSAFSSEEWKDEVERLIRHYEPETPMTDWGTDSVAEILAAEEMSARLLDHIANHLTIKKLERYYKHLCKQFPKETLSLFRKATDRYTDKNVGGSHYEYIAYILRRMREIPNGDAVVNEMLTQYRLLYKRRSAMMRTLAGV